MGSCELNELKQAFAPDENWGIECKAFKRFKPSEASGLVYRKFPAYIPE